eukprot:PhM_4_TR10055/c6_g1_i1/m.42499
MLRRTFTRCALLSRTPIFLNNNTSSSSTTSSQQQHPQGPDSNNDNSNAQNEELERERQLREKILKARGFTGQEAFLKQQQQQQQQQQGNNNTSSGGGPDLDAMKSQLYFNLIFSLAGTYLIWQWYTGTQDPAKFTMPFWGIPKDQAARWLIIQLCHEQSLGDRLKTEYDGLKRSNPLLTFAQFMDGYHPDMLSGRTVSAPEVVSMLAQVIAVASDFQLTKFYGAAASAMVSSQSSAERVEVLVQTIRSQFPQIQPYQMQPPPPANYYPPHHHHQQQQYHVPSTMMGAGPDAYVPPFCADNDLSQMPGGYNNNNINNYSGGNNNDPYASSPSSTNFSPSQHSTTVTF